MKKYLLFFCSICTCQLSFGQLSISANKTASYLANKLVATSGSLGVVVSNATLNCDSNANGEFSGTSNLGIADGIVIGTGDVASNIVANTFGLDGLPSDFASTANGFAGDAQLSTIIGTSTFDACALEFDLQPVGNFIEFEYVFGSEEYPEFICSFNDVFGFFISGPGYTSPTNIALIPSTTTEVSINTINDGTGTCPANTSLYVNNTDTTATIDGFTSPLIANATVTPGSVYHLKLVIADALDAVLNSYAIIKSNSLKSGNNIPTGLQQLNASSGLLVFPTTIDNVLNIKNSINQEWDLEIFDINGHLVNRSSISSSVSMSSINTSSLSKGVYILKAQRSSDHQNFVSKLIKE